MTRRALAFTFVLTTALIAAPTLTACSEDGDALTGTPGARAGRDDLDEDGDDVHGPDLVEDDPPNDDPAIGGEEIEDVGSTSDAGVDGGQDAGEAEPPAKVASPVPGRKVTYPYGVKNSRYAAGYHTGEDYAAPTGTNVVAVRSGKVRWSNDNGGAYGKWMGLDADNGRTYVYCHLSVRGLKAGDMVKAGQVIGKVGATGNVTGPHLHFEDHPLGPFVYAKGRKPSW
jgi:murein DD-endopeptidase MepM/ murein hydrolase activator NlpD